MPPENEDVTPEVTSDLPVADFSQWEDQEDVNPSQPEAPVEEKNESGYPGTWSPILDQLPKEFHALVAPELKKWDQGVGQRFEKVRNEAAQAIRDEYKDWDRFRASNIDPQRLENSYRIANRLEADPVGFLEDLRGLLVQNGQIQEAKQVQAEIDNLDTDPNDPLVQKLTAVEQQQAQFMEALQAAAEQQELREQEYQQQQISLQAAQQVDTELADLESKVGALPKSAKLEVLRRTNNLISAGHVNATVEDGYRDMMKFVTNANRIRPGASAPRIASSGGGSGLPQPIPASLKTSDDRMVAAQAVLDAMSD